MEAWLVDALAVTGYHGQLDRVFARGQQVTGAAMLVGTVGGGLLGQISLSVPYVVRAVLLLAVFAVAYVVMHDLGFEPRRIAARDLPGEIASNGRAGVEFGWRQPGLRLLILASTIQMGLLRVGVLRLAAVPPRAPRLGRDLDRRSDRRRHRALHDRGKPDRHLRVEVLRPPDDAPARRRGRRDGRRGDRRARFVLLGRAACVPRHDRVCGSREPRPLRRICTRSSRPSSARRSSPSIR